MKHDTITTTAAHGLKRGDVVNVGGEAFVVVNVSAGVHPIKARPLAAFHGRAIAITRASFKADWCACNDHDTPIPCRCEPVKKASAT